MAETDKPETGDKVSLLDLLKSTNFHLVFKVDAPDVKVKATAVSSEHWTSSPDSLATVKLADVRSLAKLSPRYHFCLPNDENIIPEKTTLISYISSIKENVTELQNANKEKATAILVVRCNPKSVTRTRGIDPPPVPKTSTSGDSTSTLQPPNHLPDPTPIPKADTTGMLAAIFEMDYKHPADMTGDEWNLVMLTNSLLNGLVFDPKTKTLLVARESAFQLKRTYPDAFSKPAGSTLHSVPVSRKNSEDDPDDTPTSIFSAPAYRVTDDSSVTITIVKNSLQKSMARHAFTAWDVNASVSGGYGGFSGEVSGGYGESHSQFSRAASEKGQECIHASYNFPRVNVILDAYDLELSESCKKFCQTRPFDVDGFYARFGMIFSCSVLLGARLQSISDASLFSQSNDYSNEDQMKAAFSASFSSPWVGASASASYENRTKTDQQGKQTKISMSLQWEAQGGETYLSSNPTAWIRTVAPYHNWRIIQRDDMRNILDIVDRVSPNILYSATKFEYFDLSMNKTWVLANSGYFMEAEFTESPLALGSNSSSVKVDQLGKESQWIVEYVYDKRWVTIANFGLRLSSSSNRRTLLYMAPQEIAEGCSVQLSQQPYRWKIRREIHSSSAYIYLPPDQLGSSKYLYLTGVSSGTQPKPSIQLQPLDKANSQYNQKWILGEGSKEMAAAGWEYTK